MVAAGTGATTTAAAPGSMPEDYKVFQVRRTRIVDALESKMHALPLRIFQAVAAEQIIGAPFLTNPRCAEMVADVARMQVVADGVAVHDRSVRRLVPAVLTLAAASFKALNGCKALAPVDMYLYMGEALRYCAHRRSARPAKSHFVSLVEA